MTLWELCEHARSLNLPLGSYAVFGSGPLAARHIRECGDIDIIVTEDLFEELKNDRHFEVKEYKTTEVLVNEKIEIWKEWKPGLWDIKQLIDDADIIDGVPFVKITDVLRWKKLSGRDKDLEDIKLIEKYLEEKKHLVD